MSVTSNTTSSAGDAQYYGESTLPNQINSLHQTIFSTEDIAMFNNTGEGVLSGTLPGGGSGFLTSRNIIKTLDLLAEGEIEGIVSGEYNATDGAGGEKNVEGQLGWQAVEFAPHADHNPEAWLKSIYLNVYTPTRVHVCT